MVSFTLVSTQFAYTLFFYSVVILHTAYLVVEAIDSKSRHQMSKGVICTHPFGVTHGVGAIALQPYFLPLSIQLLQKVIIGMIYVPRFMKIGRGVQAIFEVWT
jgi:membrane protein CcdC involved in cytochrome C biogenesis